MGTGTLKVVAATPIPPRQVVGGKVQPVPCPWQPAAQNMKPNIPLRGNGRTPLPQFVIAGRVRANIAQAAGLFGAVGHSA